MKAPTLLEFGYKRTAQGYYSRVVVPRPEEFGGWVVGNRAIGRRGEEGLGSVYEFFEIGCGVGKRLSFGENSVVRTS